MAIVSETLFPALVAIMVVLASLGAGEAACRVGSAVFAAREPAKPSISELLAIGFAAFGTVVAIVATIGTALQPGIVTLTALAAAVGCAVLIRDRAVLALPRFSWAMVLLVPPVAIALAEALTPVNSPDELTYKLAIPHAYQLYGRVLEMPWSSHSYLVMSLHFTDLAAMIASGGIAAKLAHFGLYLAALWIVHRAVARLDERAAVWAAIVLAWTPALAVIAGWAWDEWGTLALIVVAIDRYQRWRSEGSAADLAVAFVAAGCAASVKYTALPFVAALAVMAAWDLRREWKTLAKAALVVALFGAFFYLRNAVWTGSPVAPLLLPGAPPLSHYRAPGLLRAWLDLFRGVYVIDPQMIDESAGILLPVACVVAVAASWRRERSIRDWALLGIVQLPLVVSLAPVTRNLLPALVPLALPGIVIARETVERFRGAARAVVPIVVALGLAAQMAVVLTVVRTYDMLPYLTGRQTAAQYLSAARNFARPYAWISGHTSPAARILLLGENRTFYLERPFIAAGNFDGPRIAAWLAQPPSAAALDSTLRRERITHVLIHKPWYRVGHAAAGEVEREWILEVPLNVHRVLTEFLATRCTLQYRDPEYLVYEIVR